jgi:hypothetical protein
MVEVGIFCWPEEAMRVVIEKTFAEEVEEELYDDHSWRYQCNCWR